MHDWFEGRGAECCLLNAVDDATGRVYLKFDQVLFDSLSAPFQFRALLFFENPKYLQFLPKSLSSRITDIFNESLHLIERVR